MRALTLITAVGLLTVLVACNSQEGYRGSGNTAQKTQTPPASKAGQQPDTLNTARRITADDLHKLWQKDEVLIVDTRTEPAFNQGHIRGAILIPTNEFAARADELPKSKMIVTYCT